MEDNLEKLFFPFFTIFLFFTLFPIFHYFQHFWFSNISPKFRVLSINSNIIYLKFIYYLSRNTSSDLK